MKKKILNILKKPFVRNILVLVTGTAASQVLGMLFSPLITRLYGPEAYGLMGTFTSMANIIIPIAALSYPIAIVLPKKERDAKRLIYLSLLITFAFGILSLLIILIFKNIIINIFNLKEIGNFLLFVPLIVLFAGTMQIMEQWLIRTKQFSVNARATFLKSVITNFGKAGIGFFYPLASVLVIITVFSNGIKGFLMFVFNKTPILIKEASKGNEKAELKKIGKKYYDFPFYRSPEQFLNATSNSFPTLMLIAFFGPASAGFYSIGRTVLRIPTHLVGKSVGDVFYPRISQAYNNNENITVLLKKATVALLGVGIIPYGLIILFGPHLFSFVFGDDWIIAGEYARWLALWSFSEFINRPSVRSLAVLSAQRLHLLYTTITLVIRLTALFIGYYFFSSDVIAVALFGITGAILHFGLIIITLKISRAKTADK